MAEMYATAKVIITLEVDAASWNSQSTAEQIFKAAGEEATNKVIGLIRNANGRGIRIVGKPEVTTIFGKSTV